MLFADFPKSTPIGVIGYTFIHHCGRPIRQRAIRDVAVTGYPADVSCAPVDITRSIIEDIVKCGCDIGEVPASGMQHAFGFSGRPRGVQNK